MQGSVSRVHNGQGWVVLLETDTVSRVLGRSVPEGQAFAVTFVDGVARVVNTDVVPMGKDEHALLMGAAHEFNRAYEMWPTVTRNPDGSTTYRNPAPCNAVAEVNPVPSHDCA